AIFNNLAINKINSSYDSFTIASGDTIEVLGDLTLTNGKIITGTIAAKGNLLVDAAFNGGTGSLIINGTSAQTLLINGGMLPNFTIDNPQANLSLAASASATMSGTFTLAEGNILFDSGGSLTVSGDYTQSGGNFHGGNSTLAFNDDFVISSGNFTATSGTISFSPNTATFLNFRISAGANFVHNGGTLDFYSTGSSNHNIDVATSATFNNLTINKINSSNDYFTIASGDIVEVLGDLILTNGRMNTGTIVAKGDFSVGPAFNGGSGNLQISGTGVQALDFSGVGGVIPNLLIDNPLATLTLAANASSTISGTLTLLHGTITCSEGTMSLSTAYTQSGGDFIGGNAALTFNSDFVISGGNFMASSLTTTITSNSGTYRNFTISGSGNFIHSNGTLSFSGTNSSNHTVDVSDTLTLHNLTLNNTNGTNDYFTLVSGDTIEVLGDLILTDGRFEAGTIEVHGDVSLGAAFNGGSGNLSFIGG
ncbi:MAG: hypothetical protein HQL31_04300, partial [Planctomycetes bacterium]|nr:hypothetical protein [Planctomycetota bacterium]